MKREPGLHNVEVYLFLTRVRLACVYVGPVGIVRGPMENVMTLMERMVTDEQVLET